MTLSKLIMAARIATWPTAILARFASQYGSPSSYTLVERAKLLGTYGDIAKLIDLVQQATIAPFAKKGKPPKSVLPNEDDQDKKKMTESEKDFLTEMLGVNRQGEGLSEDAIRSYYSDSMD